MLKKFHLFLLKNKMDLETIFICFDANKKGNLNSNELFELLSKFNLNISPAVVDEIFKKMTSSKQLSFSCFNEYLSMKLGIGTCVHLLNTKKWPEWSNFNAISSVLFVGCKSFFWFFAVFPPSCSSSIYFLFSYFLGAIFFQDCCFFLDYFSSIDCFGHCTFHFFQSSFLHIGFWGKWCCFIVLEEIVIKFFIHTKLATWFTWKSMKPWIFPLFMKWGHFGKIIEKIMRPPSLKFWEIALLPGWLRRMIISGSFCLIWKNLISLSDLHKFPLCLFFVMRVFVRVPDNCQPLVGFFDFLRAWISVDP